MKNKKTLATFVLVLVVWLVCLSNVNGVKSQSEAVSWASSKQGVGISYYGNGSYQCVDLIYSYYNWLGATPGYWNACDYITNTLPSGWQRISNYDGFIPQPGDIAVWKTNHSCGTCSTTWAGHVGIVVAGNSVTFDAINQNFDSQPKCTRNQFYTSSLACVIRPDFSGVSTAVSVRWNDNPDETVQDTDAVLSQVAYLSGVTNKSITEVRMYLYDYNGKMLDYIIEDTTNTTGFSGQQEAVIWYNCNKDLGYTLSPGTVYKYKFSVTINGVSYTSPVMEITTTGKHSHVYDDGNVTIEPTCTRIGVRTYMCITCGDTKTAPIPATGEHIAGNWIVTKNATCTQSGTRVKNCTMCKITLLTETISAKGHSWGAGVTTDQPTCAQNGVKTYICVNCSEDKTETIPATGAHQNGNWIVTNEPNCTDTGIKTIKCTLCQATIKTEMIDAFGHKYGDGVIILEATCVNNGSREYTCNTCGEHKKDVIPATGEHVYGRWMSINSSEHKRVCTLCEKIESKAHRWDSGTLTIEPSENKDGVTVYKCRDCIASKTQPVPSTHAHSYGEEWKSEAGTHWHACSCGARKDEDKHILGAAATEHTNCECTVCGYIITPALDHIHSYGTSWESDENEHWHICDCGDVFDKKVHTWSEEKVMIEPTEDTEGEKKTVCSICFAEKIEKLPKLESQNNGFEVNVVKEDNITKITLFAIVGVLLAVNFVLIGVLAVKKFRK